MAIRVSTSIACSPASVFTVCTDIERWTERIRDIIKVELLTEGPMSVGTRFRETRMMFGREATEEMEVTAFEPGQSYTLQAENCGAQYVTKTDFRTEGDGCRVTMEMHVRPITLLAKLMMPLGWLMSGMLKKCLEKDLNDLKHHLESPASPAAA